MPSKRYSRMVERRDSLRRLLIPRAGNLSGSYKRVTKEKAFAYALLMHAEIESYVEEMICEIADGAVLAWRNSEIVTRPLVSMVVYREGAEVGFSEDIFNISSGKRLDTVLMQCKSQFDSRVRNNHGIRRKHLTALMMSIGFVPDASEQALLNALDGFGAKRGDFAHKSPDAKLLKATDPITEADEIVVLIDNMAALDDALVKYRSDCGL